MKKQDTKQMIAQYKNIPLQAFRYFPTLQDQRQIIPNSKKPNPILRWIYHESLNLQPYEKQKLQQFDKYIKDHRIQLDSFWDKGWRIRWLTSTNFNIQQTYKDMIIYDNFRKQNSNPKYTQVVRKYLESGSYYIAGRDAKFRPIIVFDIKKILSHYKDDQQLIQSQTYFFEFIINQLLIPGQVQTWVSIIDQGNQGVLSYIGVIKLMIIFLSNTYRNRMYSLHSVNSPTSVYYAWKLVKPFMDPVTVKKINFYDNERPTKMFQYTNMSQMQRKFGGQAKNIVSYWPYKQLSKEYAVKEVYIEIVDRQQYQKMYEQGRFINTKIQKRLINIKKDNPIQEKSFVTNTSSEISETLKVKKMFKQVENILNLVEQKIDIFLHREENLQLGDNNNNKSLNDEFFCASLCEQFRNCN